MTLAPSLRTKLATRAYPETTRRMQAYLKSGMPYYCVNLPELCAICKVVTGAWWDLVDGVPHVFGASQRKYPKEIRPGDAHVEH